MGSPFNRCDIKISREWAAKIDQGTWQDKMAKSPDGRKLALIRWDINDKNEPGFRVLTLDSNTGNIEVSNRVSGCCRTLVWTEKGLSWETA